MNLGATYRNSIPQLGDVVLAYAEAIRKPLPDVLVDQANKLSCSDFGGGNRGLFQEAAAIAPTKEELARLPELLHWHIKRKGRPIFTLYRQKTTKRGKNKGRVRMVKVTEEGEINRRIRARLYQASGWLNVALSKYASGALKKGNRASVYLGLVGDDLVVRIINSSTNAGLVNDAHGDYVAVALATRQADMLEYINSHVSETSGRFTSLKFNG